MNTISERIIYVCNEKADGNMSAFARQIGVTPAYISKLKNEPDRTPSDRTIADICREFGVDRIWLETGAGEPFKPVDRNEQIAAVLSRAIAGNDTARDRLIRAFSQLPDEMFDHAEKILEEIVANLQKEKE
jgi:transcriptional regulator with XRE-family HTH domain